ncbi:hypothetical protein [Caproiciproducens sp.]|uniref:hypothetical protein n=1 Tax=Caproiciproducens sp. TaxID=1954376 RepID=UPI0028A1DB15|nr:hypothetical protein [Caproiciproducens sp.]
MITILTLKDSSRAGQIIRMVPAAENNAQVLVMSEGDKELGYVVVDVRSSVVRMLKMEISGCGNLAEMDVQSRMYADSMMRATASYGATLGAYRIESQVKGLQQFLFGCGFIQSNHKLSSPLSNFIKICQK